MRPAPAITKNTKSSRGAMRPLVGVPEVLRRSSPYATYNPKSAADAGKRSRLADSHAGLEFYEQRRCEECHVERGQAQPHHPGQRHLPPVPRRRAHCLHQPLLFPLNPIRRHAYVCAKCHEGASASFATFVVHEPNPGSLATQKTLSVPVLRQLVYVSPDRRHPGLLRRCIPWYG